MRLSLHPNGAGSQAYREDRASLQLLRVKDGKEEEVGSSSFPVATWTMPLDLELGAVYLGPTQKQFVRINAGLSHEEMSRVKEVRLEVVRRGTGKVVKTFTIAATPQAILAQREKIPDGLRDDFRNLLLTDLDVSFLPLQPFDDPQRNHAIRATVVDKSGKSKWSTLSAPFCRLAHDGPQPAIRSVAINAHGDFLINDKPWMPWGVAYGHNPVYDGPAEGKYHDLTKLGAWSIYDRHGGTLADRSRWDTSCIRHVETGKVPEQKELEALWKKGLYASTVFVPIPLSGNTLAGAVSEVSGHGADGGGGIARPGRGVRLLCAHDRQATR